jgi:hypothetical protein
MSLIKGLKESVSEDKPTTFKVVAGDGTVKEVKGIRKKAGSGGRATIVEMFADAVRKRTGQEVTEEE